MPPVLTAVNHAHLVMWMVIRLSLEELANLVCIYNFYPKFFIVIFQLQKYNLVLAKLIATLMPIVLVSLVNQTITLALAGTVIQMCHLTEPISLAASVTQVYS